MREFGRLHYENVADFNFEKSKRLKEVFSGDYNIDNILTALQLESGEQIIPEKTLIIFDEIQAVPDAITSLKYFNEDANEYHIIAAGSLLGIALHADLSFPVGKVDFIDLFPLNIAEFLEALGEEQLLDLLNSGNWKLISTFKSRFIERLRQYYFVGGMPEVVDFFTADQNYSMVRKFQNQILNAYDLDFSKHAPESIVPRIRMVWNSVPSQLAKENRKFVYGLIREGARAKDFEQAINWLVDCGQVYKVNKVTKPGMPLKAYEDLSAFKLFLVDIGLLGAMTNIDSKSIIEGNRIFTEFKGALSEQFVLQQLLSLGDYMVKYWSAERSRSEVDFIVQFRNHVFPLEVKAEENLRSKSLRVFHEKFAPELSVRTSMSDFRQQDWMTNLPLYAINQLSSLFE
jgi:predicted AAA+ superfamily ATPase